MCVYVRGEGGYGVKIGNTKNEDRKCNCISKSHHLPIVRFTNFKYNLSNRKRKQGGMSIVSPENDLLIRVELKMAMLGTT